MEPIFLKPVFKQMIWGGSRLKEFGYEIPGDDTGECWAISAHPNGDGTVAGGSYDGMKLSELWDTHRELFGNAEGDRYPLLIKLIDAKADLSIQVHPNDEYAKKNENGSLGKTECWYIVDCDEGAQIVIGHHAKTHDEVKDMIENKRWSDFIRVIPIHKGDFFQINPGTVHAIKGGTLILETQQNSDITYRVYDYDRLSNGKPRELHVEKSIDVIEAPFVPYEVSAKTEQGEGYERQNLITCPVYSVDKLTIHGKAVFHQDKPFLNVSILDGEGTIDGREIKKGDHFILPAGYGEYALDGNMMIITSNI
ncbi:MAG: mannose-6-phosphate isomerase, class I [Lachnospiraceae bacterium]|nr:mannose-6-phosphate isomerase, class I [Lachnospiraceae bacterium]MBR1567332.1 mannose-6-phosphate isomerase, class I [Lachnospiraceae bacterium]